jgi:hypothetical protein
MTKQVKRNPNIKYVIKSPQPKDVSEFALRGWVRG